MSSYEPVAVTDELVAFGRLLVEANRDRTKHLEGKGLLVVGYCLGVLALLVASEPSVVVGWPTLFLRLASVCAAVGLGCACLALRVSRHAWLSDSQWFENEKGVLEDVDSLKRCHVMALHAVNARLNGSNDRKANSIIAAQGFLVAAGVCLAAWVIVG